MGTVTRTIALLLVLAGLAAADPVSSFNIVFTSKRTATNSIWIMKGDGTGQTQLTDDTAEDITPAISPDGTRIAFASTRGGPNNRLYSMNLDGTGITELASTPGLNVQFPSWTPDGRILFSANIGSSTGALYIVDADGQSLTQLTSGYDGRPFLSPDGNSIWFDRRTSGLSFSHQLFRMDPNGTNIQQLTFGGPSEQTTVNFGGFSPDGSRVTYMRGHGITVADATVPLSNANELFAGSFPNNAYEWPSWSPDGEWLAFARGTGSDFEIYIVRPDGTELTQLTTATGNDYFAGWGVVPAVPEPSLPLLLAAAVLCVAAWSVRRA